MTFNTTVVIDSVPLDVEYTYIPGEPATWSDPGYGDELEIEEISLAGHDISTLLSPHTAKLVYDRLSAQHYEQEQRDNYNDYCKEDFYEYSH